MPRDGTDNLAHEAVQYLSHHRTRPGHLNLQMTCHLGCAPCLVRALWCCRVVGANAARCGRQKADQDPAEWLPGHTVICRYVADWTAVKHRWALSVDPVEQQTLTDLAAGCPDVPIAFTPAD